eukprot:Selendium_serpulae@DN6371_c1_g1_i7.p1
MPRGKAKTEDDVYTMDDVMDYRKSRGKDLFLVAWKGYPKEEATWEPAANIFDPSEDILKKMEQLRNSAGEKSTSPKRKSVGGAKVEVTKAETKVESSKAASGKEEPM